ncbi:aldo/keto reductase [Luteipulveratus mongoliensis]|uniref:Aldo/keto reductase n=1 Tax=Luteipulveratus mongoliensis TaxID=571913 RepID=A0A0K1JJ37_9MICO|nr:aldo/keto reductase [Luteipulveratus mongoliensis]AKU16722.1 aldo/keto reductase [Luteipulveratus mongoliensis]
MTNEQTTQTTALQQTRTLGATGPTVGAIGLGCMGMSALYGPADRDESLATVRAALDSGLTLLDTGDFYGMGGNELLLRDALHGRPREDFLVSVKYGAQRDPDGSWLGFDASPAATRTALTYTLTRLGLDHVDIYRPARLDPDVPIEETVGALADLVERGYVRYIGLSEVGAATLRRAATVHPISDLQIEYSLASRGIEETILATCRELGIGITAYGVLSRGLLSGRWGERSGGAGDFRSASPRFQGDNLQHNLALVEQLRTTAAGLGLSVSQAAIAWVAAQGEDIVPLVGSRTRSQLADTLDAIARPLDDDAVAALEMALPRDSVAGDRYAGAQMAMLDSEQSR